MGRGGGGPGPRSARAGAYLGSALPGQGWLLPSRCPAHRSAPARLPHGGAERRADPRAPAGTHPLPAPRRCRTALLGRSGRADVSALYPPLPTLWGFHPASSTCGLSSPLWAFLPLSFLWLRVSPQTRFYESGLVQGLYKVFSEIRGPVICKTNKNVQKFLQGKNESLDGTFLITGILQLKGASIESIQSSYC